MRKVIYIFLGCILIVFILIQYRHFYQVENMTFTVWKRFGGKCYITPYKYWGITSPSKNYMIVSNLGDYTIYIDVDSTLIIASESQSQDKAKLFLEKYQYLDYPNDLDSINRFGIQLNQLREKLPFISLSIREPYAVISNKVIQTK